MSDSEKDERRKRSKSRRMSLGEEIEAAIARISPPDLPPGPPPMAVKIPLSEAERAHIDHIRERSYVRHVLARHIQTNDPRIGELRRKHGM